MFQKNSHNQKLLFLKSISIKRFFNPSIFQNASRHAGLISYLRADCLTILFGFAPSGGSLFTVLLRVVFFTLFEFIPIFFTALRYVLSLTVLGGVSIFIPAVEVDVLGCENKGKAKVFVSHVARLRLRCRHGRSAVFVTRRPLELLVEG